MEYDSWDGKGRSRQVVAARYPLDAQELHCEPGALQTSLMSKLGRLGSDPWLVCPVFGVDHVPLVVDAGLCVRGCNPYGTDALLEIPPGLRRGAHFGMYSGTAAPSLRGSDAP